MLLRQTLLYLPAQVVAPLAQVLAAIVWTHWLAPAPYGLLTLLIASQDFMFLVCLSWWTQYTLRYFGGLGAPQRDRFQRSEASVAAFASAAQAIGTFLILVLLRVPITPGLALAAIAYVATRSLLTHLGERARAQSRIGIYTLGQFTGSVLGFTAAYAAVALVAATPAAVLGGFATAQACGVALMWRALAVRGRLVLPHRDVIAPALAYGAPLLLAGIAAWIAQNGIRFEVDSLAGADALGLIAVGWGLGQRLSATLAMLVIAASFPLAVRDLDAGSRSAGYRQISLAGLLLIGLVLPASIGLCFLAEPFTTTFVAAPFRSTTIAVLPYAIAVGAVRNIRIHIADPIFLLIERPRAITAINVADAVCILIGCLVGLEMAGLVGAVAGCLAGTLLACAAGFVLAQRLGGFVFAYRDALRVAAASVIMGGVLWIVPWSTFAGRPLTRMLVETTVGSAIYAAALAVLFPAIKGILRHRIGEAYRLGIGVPLR